MARRDLESGGGVTKNNRSAEENYSAPESSHVYDSETHWTSWLVPMFVVANIAVFVITMYINNCPRNNLRFQGRCVARFLGRFSFQPMQENPLLGPSSSTLTKMGALRWDNVVNRHQGWRLVTCIWLHAGVIHLLANMLSLVFIGIRLEQQFGFIKIGIIYLVSGFGGSVLSSLFIRDHISVGASGALFGLLGAMLSELITNWTIYSNKAMALITLLVIIVINLGIGILPHVDNFAHIGGFLVGLLLGFILLPRPQFGWLEQRRLPAGVQMKSKYKTHQYVHDLKEHVIKPVIPEKYLDEKTIFHLNPSGRFVIGGPHGDAGLTGRKIIIDTYGGWGAHGGGAFSGKDPTKVDRSGAYIVRQAAKSIVASGLARRCIVQVSYAIGVPEPLSVFVDTYGTGKIPDKEILNIVKENFDFRPGMISINLDLKRGGNNRFLKTAAYGHFGREDPDFTWEVIKPLKWEEA